eukprot:754191-Hanusia_phi.AAC.2
MSRVPSKRNLFSAPISPLQARQHLELLLPLHLTPPTSPPSSSHACLLPAPHVSASLPTGAPAALTCSNKSMSRAFGLHHYQHHVPLDESILSIRSDFFPCQLVQRLASLLPSPPCTF